VAALFEDWVRQHVPTKHAKILQRMRALWGGKLNDAHLGVRMQGEGAFTDHIAALFALGCRKAGLQSRTCSCPPRPFAVLLARNCRYAPNGWFAVVQHRHFLSRLPVGSEVEPHS